MNRTCKQHTCSCLLGPAQELWSAEQKDAQERVAKRWQQVLAKRNRAQELRSELSTLRHQLAMLQAEHTAAEAAVPASQYASFYPQLKHAAQQAHSKCGSKGLEVAYAEARLKVGELCRSSHTPYCCTCEKD